MMKERGKFAVLHSDTVGIQTDVVPERIGLREKLIVQGKIDRLAASVCNADLTCNLLKAFPEKKCSMEKLSLV